jgi:hypothetical protein
MSQVVWMPQECFVFLRHDTRVVGHEDHVWQGVLVIGAFDGAKIMAPMTVSAETAIVSLTRISLV